MAHPGYLAIVIGVALGTALYYYLKGDNHQQYSHSDQRSDNHQQHSHSYQRRTSGETPPSSSTSSQKRKNRTTRRKISNICVICLEPLAENKTSLICSHEFHLNCIKTWFHESDSTRCPLCSKTNDGECIICHEPLTNNKYRLNCDHTFHTYCIQKWFRESRTCPLCRQ